MRGELFSRMLDLRLLFFDLRLLLFDGVDEHDSELRILDTFDLTFLVVNGQPRLDLGDFFGD